MVGMPRGLSPPPGFGIVTRRTGIGRYVFETRSSRRAANHPSTPAASIISNVTPSTPGAPSFSRASVQALFENIRPMDLVVKQVEAVGGLRLRLAIELPLKVADLVRSFKAHSPIPFHPNPSLKACLKSGAFAPPALPARPS